MAVEYAEGTQVNDYKIKKIVRHSLCVSYALSCALLNPSKVAPKDQIPIVVGGGSSSSASNSPRRRRRRRRSRRRKAKSEKEEKSGSYSSSLSTSLFCRKSAMVAKRRDYAGTQAR